MNNWQKIYPNIHDISLKVAEWSKNMAIEMINKKYVEDIFSIGTSSSHSVFHQTHHQVVFAAGGGWSLRTVTSRSGSSTVLPTWRQSGAWNWHGGVRISCFVLCWMILCVCVCNKPSEMMSLYRYIYIVVELCHMGWFFVFLAYFIVVMLG